MTASQSDLVTTELSISKSPYLSSHLYFSKLPRTSPPPAKKTTGIETVAGFSKPTKPIYIKIPALFSNYLKPNADKINKIRRSLKSYRMVSVHTGTRPDCTQQSLVRHQPQPVRRAECPGWTRILPPSGTLHSEHRTYTSDLQHLISLNVHLTTL